MAASVLIGIWPSTERDPRYPLRTQATLSELVTYCVESDCDAEATFPLPMTTFYALGLCIESPLESPLQVCTVATVWCHVY